MWRSYTAENLPVETKSGACCEGRYSPTAFILLEVPVLSLIDIRPEATSLQNLTGQQQNRLNKCALTVRGLCNFYSAGQSTNKV